MKLPQVQAAVLEAASATDEKTISTLAQETGHPADAVSGAAFALAEDGLLEVEETAREEYRLTAEGREYVETGLPEVRLYHAAVEAGADDEAVPLDAVIEASGLGSDAVEIALSNYARKGYGRIEDAAITADVDVDPAADPEAQILTTLADGDSRPGVDGVETIDSLTRRGLVAVDERTERSVRLTDKAVTALMEGVEVAETVAAVTPDLITSGEWRDVEFADYNVEADAEPVQPGREHVLRQTANRVKDVLVGMGFREMEGPHVDAQFWINDCLFMPQDHPARTHWDQFDLAEPEAIDELPADLVERVKAAHLEGVGDDGDGYHSPWTEAVARSLDLRGHTTSLSMRFLSGYQKGKLEPPARYFSVEKVYRNDTLDPTHLLEFFQIEGWVMAGTLSARDLMGTFTEFYEQFGITDLEFKPHYNPYTEPSFELFGTHPETGDLVEVGNSGIFRDEVLQPLGVDADVMAWGLSLERLLMLMYGFEDIRDVHGTLCDLDLLRNVAVVH